MYRQNIKIQIFNEILVGHTWVGVIFFDAQAKP